MSYRQTQELGGQVRKGEKCSLVVYANTITKTEENEEGQEEERSIPYMKGYTVFNVEQIDGLPAQYLVKPEPMKAPAAERIERAERFFAATGANIRYGGNSAYYAPHTDHIQMPRLKHSPMRRAMRPRLLMN